jgi:uncharacterized membrane protein
MPEAAWTTATLVTAAIVSGLNAGLFYGFTCAVMPGLRQVDARTFVMVMQSINRRIINPVFLVVFLGAPVLAIGSLVLAAVAEHYSLLAAAGAVTFSVLTIVITGAANVPLNNALDAAGDPDTNSNLGAVRQRFENRWVRWNIARTVTSTAASALLVVALVG